MPGAAQADSSAVNGGVDQPETPPGSSFVETFEQGWEEEPDSIALPPVPILAADTIHGYDCLGVLDEARAFARVICSRETEAPLAIGLFGDWGAGKSFFMGLMQDEINARCDGFERVAPAVNDERGQSGLLELDQRWHRKIAQITFNAWHYAESNLWASLITHIFDELTAVMNPTESLEESRSRLLAELSESKQHRAQVQFELRRAEQRWLEATAERELREAELARTREELAVVEVAAPKDASPRVTTPVDGQVSVSSQLRVDGLLGKLRVTWRWIWARGRIARAGLILAIGLVMIGAFLAIGWWRNWWDLTGEIAMATLVIGLLISGGSILSTWLSSIRPILKMIQSTYQSYTASKDVIDGGIARAIGDLLRPGESLASLARQRYELAQVDLERAKTAADESAGEITRFENMLRALDGGRSLFAFIRERSESDDYRRHLGLVSSIRKDFVELENILQRVQCGAPSDGGTPEPISRIVLYVDDLDRCEPERVVEVLQAVHMLLAVPIFVVVVAVDVRWLRRSLARYYDRILVDHEDAHGPDDGSRPTPKNYLEKIFQVPFCLRPMSRDGLSSLLRRLGHADLENQLSASSPEGEEHTRSPSEVSEDEMWPLRREEQDAEILNERLLRLEPQELAFMQNFDSVINTPRLAKILVNTYRLLRAEIRPGALEAYLRDRQYRYVLCLLAVQVGRAAEAAVIFDSIHHGDPHEEIDHVIERLLSEDPSRWLKIQALLHEIGVATDLLTNFRPWTDRVRRFSFHPWTAA